MSPGQFGSNNEHKGTMYLMLILVVVAYVLLLPQAKRLDKQRSKDPHYQSFNVK